MKSYLKRLVNNVAPFRNDVDVMKEAVKDLCLRISNQTLREKYDKHPNTYSLLAFQDLFYDFNVDNITIKCSDMNRLISYKGSAIVQVMIDQNY